MTVGPLVGEAGEDLGTYEFKDVPAPSGLLLPLVAGLERAAGPGGRWRARSSVEAGAKIVQRLATDIAAQHPEVTSIKGLTPEVFKDWRKAVEATATWPGQINLARALLQDTEGVPRETLQALRTDTAPKPDEAAEEPYDLRSFRLIRRTMRHEAAAVDSRIQGNTEDLARYLAGMEPADCLRVRFSRGTSSIGELREHLRRAGKMPEGFTHGASRQAKELVRESLGLPSGTRLYCYAFFPSNAEIYALMALFVCETGFNASVITSFGLGSVHRADDPRSDRPVYTIEVDKPRRGPANRYTPETIAGRRARLWDQAVRLTQPARDALAELGYPTDQLLVAGSNGASDHPTHRFITDWSTVYKASDAWHRYHVLIGDDGQPIRVGLRRLRATVLGLQRRRGQNTQQTYDRNYAGRDSRMRERMVREVERGQAAMLDDKEKTLARRVSSEELRTAVADPSPLAKTFGVSNERIIDLATGRLTTPGAVSCIDIEHSPYPEDAGGTCTASFLLCAGCPNAVSTPEQLPSQVALVDVLDAAAAAVHGTAREGEFDLHVIQHRSLIGSATPAERERARADMTADDIETAERLLRREFDV